MIITCINQKSNRREVEQYKKNIGKMCIKKEILNFAQNESFVQKSVGIKPYNYN